MAQVILVPKGKRLRVFLIGINTFLVTFTGWFTFLHFQKTSVMLWTASFAMTIFVAWVIDRRNSPKDISWERDGVIIVLLLGSSVAFTFNLIWNNGFQFWMFWPLANAMLTVWNRSIQRRISLVNQSDVERAIVVLQTGLVGFAVALIGSYLTFGEHFYPSQINLNPQFLRYILIAGLCSTMVPITRMFAGAEPKATVTNQQIIMLFSSFVFGFGISIVYGEPVYGTSLGTLLIMAVTVVIYLTKWSRPSDR